MKGYIYWEEEQIKRHKKNILEMQKKINELGNTCENKFRHVDKIFQICKEDGKISIEYDYTDDVVGYLVIGIALLCEDLGITQEQLQKEIKQGLRYYNRDNK